VAQRIARDPGLAAGRARPRAGARIDAIGVAPAGGHAAFPAVRFAGVTGVRGLFGHRRFLRCREWTMFTICSLSTIRKNKIASVHGTSVHLWNAIRSGTATHAAGPALGGLLPLSRAEPYLD
jgi:hypothetical protein